MQHIPLNAVYSMFNRFPDLANIPQGTPAQDGFLECVFFLLVLSALVYVIPVLALALFLTGLPYAAKLTGILGIIVCIALPSVWAVLVPAGLWYLLLPLLAPAILFSFLMYRGASARLVTQAREHHVPLESGPFVDV